MSAIDGPRDRASTGKMPRVTVRLPEDLLDEVDGLADDGLYASRSEAMRAGLRQLVEDSTDGGEQ